MLMVEKPPGEEIQGCIVNAEWVKPEASTAVSHLSLLSPLSQTISLPFSVQIVDVTVLRRASFVPETQVKS